MKNSKIPPGYKTVDKACPKCDFPYLMQKNYFAELWCISCMAVTARATLRGRAPQHGATDTPTRHDAVTDY